MAESYDAIVVGSGMGGSMAAKALLDGGMRVLMIERGDRVVRGEHTWAPDAVLERSPYYSLESHYVVKGSHPGTAGTYQCVGGPSVFYGGVSLRLREADFETSSEFGGDEGAEWPISYLELAPYYTRAEQILGVAGRLGDNPTDPPGMREYLQDVPDAQGPSVLMSETARSLGLDPCHVPLAIDFGGLNGSSTGTCVKCGTCDGFACGVGAKRDPGVALIPELEQRGMALLPSTVVVRILWRAGRIEGLVVIDRMRRVTSVVRGSHYVLAAGALGSAHLVQAAGLGHRSSAREWVGAGLMRHCNGIVYGLWSEPLEGSRDFHKQLGFFDHYGDGNGSPKLGCIQSIHPPPVGMVQDRVPTFMHGLGDWMADRSTGLLAIAEDEPRRENRVDVDRKKTDRWGIPRAVISHTYTARDIAARAQLVDVAKRVVKRAGARITHMFPIKTFSHAVGTLRMGNDPATAPLDWTCRYRGIDNLWVADGSVFPRSGGVNPSLTIAANALRVGQEVVDAAGGMS